MILFTDIKKQMDFLSSVCSKFFSSNLAGNGDLFLQASYIVLTLRINFINSKIVTSPTKSSPNYEYKCSLDIPFSLLCLLLFLISLGS